MQSENVDPVLHLFILLPCSFVCKIIVRVVPSPRTYLYKMVYAILNACCCSPVYRTRAPLLPQSTLFSLLKYFYLEYSLLEGQIAGFHPLKVHAEKFLALQRNFVGE